MNKGQLTADTNDQKDAYAVLDEEGLGYGLYAHEASALAETDSIWLASGNVFHVRRQPAPTDSFLCPRCDRYMTPGPAGQACEDCEDEG